MKPKAKPLTTSPPQGDKGPGRLPVSTPAPAWVLWAILAWTLVVFLPSLRCDFIRGDDDAYILENANVARGLSLESVLLNLASTVEGLWHPLTTFGFHLQYQAFGLNPVGYHATNVAIHLANVWLLFHLLTRLLGPGWRAPLIALAFAIHPLRMESVVWACELKDVGSVFFTLASMWFYLNWARSSHKRDYALCFLFHLASMLFKPMFVTLPVLLLLLDFHPLKRLHDAPPLSPAAPNKPPGLLHRGPIRALIEKIPLFASSALVTIAVHLLAKQVPISTFGKIRPGLYFQLSNVPISYARYIKKLLFLEPFSVHNPIPLAPWPVPLVFLSLVLLAGVSLLITLGRKKWEWQFVGWWWYVVTLLPAIWIVFSGLDYAIADRYTYMATVGLMLMVPPIPPKIIQARPRIIRLAGFLAVVAAAAVGISTFFYIGFIWTNSLAQFRYNAAVMPGSSLAWNNLAVEEARLGREDLALAHFRRCYEIEPDMYVYPCNLALALSEKNTPENDQEALELTQKCLGLYGRYIPAHTLRAFLLDRRGQAEKAVHLLDLELQIQPSSEPLWMAMVNALEAAGRADEARAVRQKLEDGARSHGMW